MKHTATILLLSASLAFAQHSSGPVPQWNPGFGNGGTSTSSVVAIVNSGLTTAALTTVVTNGVVTTNAGLTISGAGEGQLNHTNYVFNGSTYNNTVGEVYQFFGGWAIDYLGTQCYTNANSNPTLGTWLSASIYGANPAPTVSWNYGLPYYTTNNTYTTNIVGNFVGNGSGLTGITPGQTSSQPTNGNLTTLTTLNGGSLTNLAANITVNDTTNAASSGTFTNGAVVINLKTNSVGGGVTNAFYTNTTTVVVSGSSLAIGTNSFGGGVSLSGYYAPTTGSNNVFLVQGSGTIFDDYYTNAGQAITNLVVQQQAGQYLYFKGVNNGMYLVSSSSNTFGLWRLGATIPGGNGPTLVALDNSSGGSVGDPTKFTAVQYNATGTLFPAYQAGITISYATNANVLKTNIDVVVTSGLPLNSNNVSQVNLLASNQVVQLAGSSAMASFNGATPPSFDARLLTSQHFNGFEQWAALTKPPIIYDVSTYNTNPGVMQAGVLTCMTNLLNTGVLANLLSNNIPVIILQQMNWGTARTSTNGMFTGLNGLPATLSNMAWNTNCFPNGIPFVASTLASNGVSYWLGAAVITNTVPTGASGFVFDATSGSMKAYTNGVNGGFNTAASGFISFESAMTPATVLQDLSQLHSWGVSGVIGFNESTTEQVASMTSLGCMSYAFNFSGNNILNYRAGWNTPMACVYQFSVNSVPGNLLGNGVRRFCNVQMTDNSSTPANATRLRKMLIEFPGCPSANQGAYLYTESGADANTNRMACKAILSCGVSPDSANVTGTRVTNALWQTVSYDPLLSLPTLANDYTTNVGSAWLKFMSNGRYACYLENESTNSATNIVLTLPPLPAYSTSWNITNVWSAASVGNFTGSFTATNLPVGGSFFGILTPLMGSVSNKLAPASITFPATTVNWTNTFGVAITLYIDNTAVTGTSLSINGGVVFGGLSLDETITLQSGDFFSEAYTIGTPTAKWHPYP